MGNVGVAGLVEFASATGQGVLIWDGDLRLIGVNPLAHARLSLAEDAVCVGNRFVDVLSLIDADLAARPPATSFEQLIALIDEGRAVFTVRPDPDKPTLRMSHWRIGYEHVVARIEAVDGASVASSAPDPIVERLGDGVMVLDPQHRILQCNKSFMELFNVDPQRYAPGMTVLDFAHLHGDLADLPEAERNVAAELRARFGRGQQGERGYASVERMLRTGDVIQVRRAMLPDGRAVLTARAITDQLELARQKASLETMLNNLSDGVMMIDAKHRVTAYNPRALELYGIPEDVVSIGMHVRDFIAAERDLENLDKRDRAVQINERLIALMDDGLGASNGPVRLECELTTGRVLDVMRASLPKGGAVVTIRDATEDHALARKQQQLEMIVQHIDEAIVLIDGNGTVEIANQRMYEFRGIPRAVEPQGMAYTDFVRSFEEYSHLPGPQKARFLREQTGFLFDPVPEITELTRETSNGRFLRATRVPLPRGGYMATLRDVTADLNRQRLLEEAKLSAEEANRMKSDFLARVTHELRTPMHGVLGMAALLGRSKLDSQQQRCLDVLTKSGRHMLDLIDGLLTISTVETGELILEAVPIDLSEMVAHCAEMIRPRAAESGLAVTETGTLPRGRIALGDEMRIKQILTNLLTNAVKFTERGRITVDAEAIMGAERIFLRVSVIDTGQGIAPAELQSIFKKFTQLQRANQRPQEGVGLGLAIARSLTDLMAGRLDVESTLGQGSVFTLTVPLDRAHRIPAAESA